MGWQNKLLWFGIICMILSFMIGIVRLAMGQTDQDTANMNELSRYDQILTAFADACTNAVNNHDTASMAICSQVFGMEHDILKPFMDINRDAMTKVIMGGNTSGGQTSTP